MNNLLDDRIMNLVPSGVDSREFSEGQTTVTIRKILDEIGIRARMGGTIAVTRREMDTVIGTTFYYGSKTFGSPHVLQSVESNDPNLTRENRLNAMEQSLQFCEARKA